MIRPYFVGQHIQLLPGKRTLCDQPARGFYRRLLCPPSVCSPCRQRYTEVTGMPWTCSVCGALYTAPGATERCATCERRARHALHADMPGPGGVARTLRRLAAA